MRAVLIHDWRETKAALAAARAAGEAPVLVTPEDAAGIYGAGYLAALLRRARAEFPDIAFALIVDCGEAPGYALACLRAGVDTIALRGRSDVVARVADIAAQSGARLVDRPIDPAPAPAPVARPKTSRRTA